MSHWNGIRRRARQIHADISAKVNSFPSASALIAVAAELTGIEAFPVRAGHPLLDGGEAQFDPEAQVIWFNEDLPVELTLFYRAHEYAHVWLHQSYVSCSKDDIDLEVVEESAPLGLQRVEGYSPKELREREANVFAREFLLPAPKLRHWYADAGLTAADIAAAVGLPIGMVLHQLALALLVPAQDDPVKQSEGGTKNLTLDESQQAAAQVEVGPFLLEAGPGTGKTRTLTARITRLLTQGVAPTSILALTFSNKAAAEMRQRIAMVELEAAPHIWMGTFHAFGLELLRKYGTRIGLPPRPGVLDPVEAILLLERELPALQLNHYQNLYEPTMYLRDILNAISRAKDELAGPDRYLELAERMRDQAMTPEAVEAAAKACEVARVYAFYQGYLDQHDLLDFGDLIAKAVHLLRTHEDVRHELRRTYPHVLVDEYQDVNRASSLFLREIAGDGTGLWVVGDVRQAIYRFRGAAPVNMRQFMIDFPGAQSRPLARNYRSQQIVLNIFAALAPKMEATRGAPFTPWEADRATTTGEVRFEIAEDQSAEGAGIAREIERQRAAGIPYHGQAVLCRSHTTLARIGEILERAGVPILYLGDVFERSEVRDMLALLSLACEGDGRGMIRVARFPEYKIPLADVLVLRTFAQDQHVPFPRALSLAEEAPGITPVGRAGLALLAQHLDDLCYGTTAWTFVVRYLLERSNYLRALLADSSMTAQQQRFAIFQLIQFAHEHRKPGGGRDPKRAFLDYVRQLKIFGEEKQLRDIPDWAGSIDAVRLLTVHASKGLEFPVVYIPGLGNGKFPASRQAQHCPPPSGMITGGMDDAHDEEEECLLFVALSRARDVLCLSRAKQYGKRNSNAAPLLEKFEQVLPYPINGAITWRRTDGQEPPAHLPLVDPAEQPFDVEALDVYMRCPRQYYYEFVLDLSGRRADSAYVEFRNCVYAVMRWLRDERGAGRVVDLPAAIQRLTEIWQVRGPHDHAYAQMYWERATQMVEHLVLRPTRAAGAAAHPQWEVQLQHGRVQFSPDHVEPSEREGESSVVQRLRTGRATKKEHEKPIYALYQYAAEQAFRNTPSKLEIVYLSTDQPVLVRPLSAKQLATQLEKYDAAMAGILRQQFPADPSKPRDCPRCPHYFICPVAEDR